MYTRIVVICIVVAILLGFLLWPRSPEPPEEISGEPSQAPVSEEQEAAEPPRYPIPDPIEPVEPREQPEEEIEPPPDLPPLEESDPTVLETLTEVLNQDVVERWLVEERIIERAVVLVHSLDGSAIPPRMRPLRPMDDEPIIVETDDDRLLLSEENAQRYTPLVDNLTATEPEQAAQLYRRYYPLFQEAWSALGENESYFNDRLVEVLDQLIDTPEIELPVAVEPWEGHYRFADESLEELSWGRKALIRTGPENVRRIREWLREFRTAVTESEGS